jgi:Uma2 family endonuclease
MPAEVQTLYTLEDYLEMEFHSKQRHYYFNGIVGPMTYTSDDHGLIVANLIREIGVLTKETEFRVYPSDRMLFVPECQLNYYPDVMIVKGAPEFHEHSTKIHAPTNPMVIIEVLSDSTEGIDRVEKWRCYRKIDSLRQYLLIAQDKIFIDKYDRMKNTDKWENSYYDHPDQAIQIAGFDIKIKDIYHRISFEERKEEKEQ